MLIDEVDVVGGEAAERSFHRFADMLRPAVEVGWSLSPVLQAEAELRREHNLVPPTLQRPAEELFVGERTIDFGGIEKGAPELDGTIEGCQRFSLVGRAIGLTHAHAAETDGRYLKPLGAEFAFAQCHKGLSFRQ